METAGEEAVDTGTEVVEKVGHIGAARTKMDRRNLEEGEDHNPGEARDHNPAGAACRRSVSERSDKHTTGRLTGHNLVVEGTVAEVVDLHTQDSPTWLYRRPLGDGSFLCWYLPHFVSNRRLFGDLI